MNLDKLEQLIKEYLSTLQDIEDDEWYGTERRISATVLLRNPGYDLGYTKMPSFLQWLREKETYAS